MSTPVLVTVYDATVTPHHAAKLEPALAAQFGPAAVITRYVISGSKPRRARLVVQVPA